MSRFLAKSGLYSGEWPITARFPFKYMHLDLYLASCELEEVLLFTANSQSSYPTAVLSENLYPKPSSSPLLGNGDITPIYSQARRKLRKCAHFGRLPISLLIKKQVNTWKPANYLRLRFSSYFRNVRAPGLVLGQRFPERQSARGIKVLRQYGEFLHLFFGHSAHCPEMGMQCTLVI